MKRSPLNSSVSSPQGLKPITMGARIGTAKAVPFHGFGQASEDCERDCSDDVHKTAENHEVMSSRGRAALQGRVSRTKILRALAPVLLLLLVTSAFAASTDARFKDLGHRMMCTCGCGQVLLECNHVGCQSSDKMRNELQSSLDKGDNDDLILQGFVQEYGPTVIAAPTAKGFNKIAWIMPFVALAAGIIFVTWVVRAWKNRPEPALADGITIPKGSELDHFRAQARKETDL